MVIRGLIFDFDGLIIDTETPEYTSWVNVYRQHGTDISIDEWSGCLGTAPPTFDVIKALSEKIGAPVNGAQLQQAVKAAAKKIILNQPILPGIIERIDEADQMSIPLAVASSSSHAWVDQHLERLGLRSRFQYVLCRDDVKFAKPAPDLYNLALNKLGIQPNEAIAFEDSPNGITAAVTAGIFCVAVANPISQYLDISHASLQLSSLADQSLAELINLATRSNGLD